MAFLRTLAAIISPILPTIALMCGPLALANQPETPSEPRISLSSLRDAASGMERAIITFRIEGTVCAASRKAGLVIVDDGASVDLLELPELPSDLLPGSRVVIRGKNCLISRGRASICIGKAPVVEIDGLHPPSTRSGTIFLQEGMRPLRVEWFNGPAEAELGVEFQSEEMPRREVTPEYLWHRSGADGNFEPGLEYSSYNQDALYRLPDYSNLKPVGSGIVPGIDLRVMARQEMTSLVFSGFLKVPRTGLYTFHLTSDDGSRLFVADTLVSCEKTGEDGPVVPIVLNRSRNQVEVNRWVAFEGTVGYASMKDGRLELEVAGNSDVLGVTIADGAGIEIATLLHKSVRVIGLKTNSGIISIDAGQLEVAPEVLDKEKVFTKIIEIRQLRREDWVRPFPASVQGVVTMVSPKSFVLQDATGGVFVHYLSTTPENSPRPSEVWRIDGRSGVGDFSPVLHVGRATYIGEAPIPPAAKPTQQQLASGSLDAEFVEVEGVVMSVSDSEVKMLTRSGNIDLLMDENYPLPTHQMSARDRGALIGAVVRFRGVYRAIWDSTTGSVLSGRLMLGNATLSLDVPASEDPFSAPMVRPEELLLFTSHPTALRRVKIKGQMLASKPPELFFSDGRRGFRVVARQPPALMPGDEVEVSGFPQLGGPSPVLLDGLARKTGAAALPSAVKLADKSLPDLALDSTLVEIEATLLSDTMRLDDRVLEMRAGTNRFLAFLPSVKSVSKPLESDSYLRLTGVYVSPTAERALANSDPFEMRLRGRDDIVVLKRGPWWTKRHTVGVIAFLSAGLVLAFFWVTILRRTVSKRSSQLAVEIEEREAVERHRVMEQERIRMAKDLHDELGAGLTEAGILSSLMRNPSIPQKQKESYLDQLSGLCCTLVTGLDEIVWAVNPRYDSVADLAGYFSLMSQRFLGLADIGCRITIDGAITPDPVDSRKRHDIFLAFKEALNNLVRHSRATVAHLTVEVAEGDLVISLADNGTGFDRGIGVGLGSDGLRNMEERIQALGGICKIETSVGGGTTVNFKIPLEGIDP